MIIVIIKRYKSKSPLQSADASLSQKDRICIFAAGKNSSRFSIMIDALKNVEYTVALYLGSLAQFYGPFLSTSRQLVSQLFLRDKTSHASQDINRSVLFRLLCSILK